MEINLWVYTCVNVVAVQSVLHARMQGGKCVWIGDELRGKVAVVRNGDRVHGLACPFSPPASFAGRKYPHDWDLNLQSFL